jgi:hypothetical protein
MPTNPFREGPLREAVHRLFDGKSDASQALLQEYTEANPNDPLGYSLSAALPFYNLVAMRLRSQHGNSLRRTILGESIVLTDAMRQFLGKNLQGAHALAESRLGSDPRDQNATFALCVAEGVDRDVMALAFKRWTDSFGHAQKAALHARRLLELNPNAWDAYFAIGFSEHVIQEIPAMFRPFTKIPGIVGENGRAIQFLEAAARGGHYFREFARQLLLTVYTEEGRHSDATRILKGLAEDFPGNAVYRAEWGRRQQTASAQ